MPTTTAAKPFAIGDLVIVNPRHSAKFPGHVFKVTKINQTTVGIAPHAPATGRAMRAEPSMLLPAPTGQDTAAAAEATSVAPVLCIGTVVTIIGSGWVQPETDLFVVVMDRCDGTVKVVRLGGDAGDYFPKVRRERITPVPAGDLPAAVARMFATR